VPVDPHFLAAAAVIHFRNSQRLGCRKVASKARTAPARRQGDTAATTVCGGLGSQRRTERLWSLVHIWRHASATDYVLRIPARQPLLLLLRPLCNTKMIIQTKCVMTVTITGNPLTCFDISWVNPNRAATNPAACQGALPSRSLRGPRPQQAQKHSNHPHVSGLNVSVSSARLFNLSTPGRVAPAAYLPQGVSRLRADWPATLKPQIVIISRVGQPTLQHPR
jgi:hypothetical protein